MPQTMSDCPRRQSPAAKIPGTLVQYLPGGVLTFLRASFSISSPSTRCSSRTDSRSTARGAAVTSKVVENSRGAPVSRRVAIVAPYTSSPIGCRRLTTHRPAADRASHRLPSTPPSSARHRPAAHRPLPDILADARFHPVKPRSRSGGLPAPARGVRRWPPGDPRHCVTGEADRTRGYGPDHRDSGHATRVTPTPAEDSDHSGRSLDHRRDRSAWPASRACRSASESASSTPSRSPAMTMSRLYAV